MATRRCPHCGLVNPGSAVTCDCGYSFTTGEVGRSYVPPQQQRGGGGQFANQMALRIVIRVVSVLIVAALLIALRTCGSGH